MSYTPCPGDGAQSASPASGVALVIRPRTGDIGGFEVQRALPSRTRRMVGPFVFWDQMGPGRFAPGAGIDVRPHPHIGLSTVTWLFSGALQHKDSLGSDVVITPGAVNLMTAGSGIVHSERSDAATRAAGSTLFGIQSWLALPESQAEMDPDFAHYDPAQLPVVDGDGVHTTLIMGRAFGASSPVKTYMETFYADVSMTPASTLVLPDIAEERACYIISGALKVGGQAFSAGDMLVFHPGATVDLHADQAAHIMLLGGAAMDGPCYIWWNFVATSKERIRAAAEDWAAGKFPPVPGDVGPGIPVPDTALIDRIKA